MLRIVETGGIDEVGVLTAQLLGLGVHLFHKGVHISGDRLGQHVAGLIGGDHQHAVEELLHRHGLSLQNAGGAAVLIQTGGHGGVGGRQLLGQGELPIIHSLQHQQGCHDFGETGGIHLLMLIFGIDHVAGIGVHQQCGLRGDAGVRRSFGLCFRCGGQGGGKESDDQCAQQKNREKASCFHVVLLQIMI